MKFYLLILLISLSLFVADKIDWSESNEPANQSSVAKGLIDQGGVTILERISPPNEYARTETGGNSFGHYLRTLKLKPEGAKVKYYNGAEKENNGVYQAVVDLEIGTKDLHQCADAIMRLRAEYLWSQKRYDEIHFNFTNGFRVEYSEWMKGKKMLVEGNHTKWDNTNNPSNTYEDLWSYLELIFYYAGTASLEKELKSVSVNEAEIGDVLIKGGHPGHAVILVDKAVNSKNGNAIYLVAQSYMPAQEIQILQNKSNLSLSPWYELTEGSIATPEWSFTSDNLKRFEK